MEKEHENYMARCLQLARLGEGHTAPNPMVGCVVIHEGKIIGEGFHQKCGEPHAEVNALRSVKDESLLHHSSLYVSLEPCSHHGKTPPCADLIIEKEIKKIVVGTVDPNPLVSGEGIRKLREHGCNVEVGILEKECRELNHRFFTFQEKQRPYIILKWAETQDGFVDIIRSIEEHGQPNWITDEIARIAVHKQRSIEGAILIGTSTALIDNPSLTLREWYGKQPLRIVFDMQQRLPARLTLFNGEVPTLTCSLSEYEDKRKTDYSISVDEDPIGSLLHSLYERKIQSVIVEGGPTTLQHFIDANFWDEAHVYTGFTRFGNGIKAPVFNQEAISEEYFSKSKLSLYRNFTV